MNLHGKEESSAWKVAYHPQVVKDDIPELNKTEAQRIKNAIEKKLMLDPLLYGLPLRNTLKHYWKLRVGDWRIVYTIIGKTVRIIIIAHRREVYKQIFKRIQ